MSAALLERYDGLVCDLDGVVYAGPSAVPHAVESLKAARAQGRTVVFATNNASRPGEDVAAHLSSLGLPCAAGDVVNSSMAGAHLLTQADGVRTVLAIGGIGVGLALSGVDLTPVTPDEHRDGARVDAVLQGYGADVQAGDLAEAAYAIQGGAVWVATNTDRTLPTDRGRAPGNGSLVQAVQCAVDVEPRVAGKPEPIMYALASQRMGVAPRRVLAVGDRLETDIEGAVRGGMDSALVLTGVHGWADAAQAPSERRPTYVLPDLRGLAQPYEVTPSAPEAAQAVVGIADLRAALQFAWGQVDGGVWTPQQAADHLSVLTEASHG